MVEPSNSYYAQARPEMAELIPPETGMLLDVGCGQGSFYKSVRSQCPDCRLFGVEYDLQSAVIAREKYENVWAGDVFDLPEWNVEQTFDVIVFNDLLEHLADPWKCLQLYKTVLKPEGCIIASIPNMRFWPILSDLVWNANWRYREAGVMDITHLRFFTHKSIMDLFETSGYHIQTLQGINAMGGLSWKWKLLNTLTGGRFSDCEYPQYAVTATIKRPTDHADS